MWLKQGQVTGGRSSSLHRQSREKRTSLEERVREQVPFLRVGDRRYHMGEEKLSPLQGDEGSRRSHAGSHVAAGLGERLLQLGDNWIVLGQKLLIVKGTYQRNHQPGEKVVGLET